MKGANKQGKNIYNTCKLSSESNLEYRRIDIFSSYIIFTTKTEMKEIKKRDGTFEYFY